MVQFLSVKINQRVIVQHKGKLVYAVVKYKGHLNGENGDWVGVELDYPMGRHNGTWRGREYFKCPHDCGLFTHCNNIRFLRSQRHLKDTYRRLSEESFVDETLFGNKDDSDNYIRGNYSVDFEYLLRAKSAFKDPPFRSLTAPPPNYGLRHSIGGTVPAATMLNPQIACRPFQYKSIPIHAEYAEDTVSFNPVASLPHYSMPYEALVRQTKRGKWEEYGVKPPRFSTV